jgi:hypothetical protein
MESDTRSNTNFSRSELEDIMAEKLGRERVPKRFKIHRDTSDFFRVDYDDVVILGGRPYLIKNCEREGRFGLDDEPKYWVKRAIDITSGETKIIKLVFHEEIEAKVGEIVFRCVRSPAKEAAILDLVAGHKNFMHGTWVRDTAGNIVRILDYIRGKRLDDLIYNLAENHEDFFFQHLPGYLIMYREMVQAIQFIHDQGQKHGDIRRDHILLDRETGDYRWIDFDYDYYHAANMFGYDLFGLGNILIFLVGGGDITLQQLQAGESPALDRLSVDDMNVIFNNRVANIQKIHPYIPDALNYILLHFSNGANLYYENTRQLLEDLGEVRIKT